MKGSFECSSNLQSTPPSQYICTHILHDLWRPNVCRSSHWGNVKHALAVITQPIIVFSMSILAWQQREHWRCKGKRRAPPSYMRLGLKAGRPGLSVRWTRLFRMTLQENTLSKVMADQSVLDVISSVKYMCYTVKSFTWGPHCPWSGTWDVCSKRNIQYIE